MMKQAEIKALFEAAFDNNPGATITKYLEYGQSGKYLYELIHCDFMNRDLHGVTVLKLNGDTANEFSECFDTRHGADLYIEALERK